MGLALFGFSYLSTLLVAAGVAVYGFGFVEEMWGKGGSFQVLAMMGFVVAFLATIAFGISAALTRRFGGNARSALLGSVAAAATTMSAYALSRSTGAVGTGGIIALIVGLAALAAAGNPRNVV